MKKFWSYPLVEFSSAFDADVVKIIDNEYLSRNNCLSDEDALKKILEVKHEMEKYNRAVICLDLDKISGIRLEESSLQGEMEAATKIALTNGKESSISYSYQYERPQTYWGLLQMFESLSDDKVK